MIPFSSEYVLSLRVGGELVMIAKQKSCRDVAVNQGSYVMN